MLVKESHLVPALIVAVDVRIVQLLYRFIRCSDKEQDWIGSYKKSNRNKDYCNNGGNDHFFFMISPLLYGFRTGRQMAAPILWRKSPKFVIARRPTADVAP